MKLETEPMQEALIVRALEPRLDAAVAVQFKDAIRGIAGDAPDRVILDLERVTFLDSSGLGAVIGAMKLLSPDHRLELAALNPAVAKVFKLTKMDALFTIHETAPKGPAEPFHAS
ncbi:STAS domain-containing protein [Palleronia abyssalis]|uniref:Anti-sigma factor antagonist n=1 Tax=Palleronia abyssalis TaxID=1501240 RepID=A0A2R8BT94_9RHOB|nr:STAS domain-containing protein [Palleronia abyssalis]SPJ23348.1 Putative anti-sigma factor antagonist [Palleronia abyssalis]